MNPFKWLVMEKIVQLESVAQFNTDKGQETRHPLVTVLDNAKSKLVQPFRFISGLYIVYLKEVVCGELQYGRSNYDYEEGTLVFVAPGQVYGVNDYAKLVQPKGWTLAFHLGPDTRNCAWQAY